MASWRDEVVAALQHIGGEGTLADIYASVQGLHDGDLPASWQAIVRRELEYNSSDSESYQKRFDLFRSVDGIGSGTWALREDPKGSSQTEDWSDEEVAALVIDYFAMLKSEVNAQPYSKSAHIKELMKTVLRSPGAIEYKHQNVSAILDRLGYRWIEGYKPRANIQGALTDEVVRHLRPDAALYDRPVEIEQLGETAYLDVFVPRPKPTESPAAEADFEPIARQHDIAARDARNRELGRAGEEFVYNLEQKRLVESGRADLAKLVVWVSRDIGDGLGYDIESFDLIGAECVKTLIEVKTTKGPIECPFFVSANEILASTRNAAHARLYRVFHFGKQPKIYVIPGSLDEALHLEAASYRATVKAETMQPSQLS